MSQKTSLHKLPQRKAQSTQDARRDAKEMEPIDVKGGVHTACKQHQRKNVPICARVV